MEETRRNILVGLFVLAGFVALGTMIVVFRQGATFLLRGERYVLHIQFASAAGIRQGNLVTVGGLEVGRVESVDFIDPQRFDAGVSVTVRLERKYQIPNDSHAFTNEPALGQGRPPIQIVPGTSETKFAAGATLPGEVRAAIESIFPKTIVATFEKTATNVGEAAGALTPVLKDLHEIMTKRAPGEVDRLGGLQGNLSSALARFDAALKHVNEVLGDPETQSHLKEAVANLHTVTEDAKAVATDLKAGAQDARQLVSDGRTLIAKATGTVERLDGEIATVGRDARNTLEKGSRLMDSLYEITSTVSRGEGTLGRLVHDAKLYDAMVFTAERLGHAVEEFRLLIQDWQKGKVRVAF
jgi:phospholipid/cholesterol/gamma-HCH transport system substrate-binding protein